jgi:hypothetical protein
VIDFYRQPIAEGTNYCGYTTLQHERSIGDLIRKHGARTMLDYGCGAGYQYTQRGLHERWGVPMPTLYDPASEMHGVKPVGTFDGVLCVDVLEHMEEHFVGGVIADLARYADGFLYVSVCCREATKFLPDGRNTHLTLQEFDWWRQQFATLVRPDVDLCLTRSP